MNKIITLTICAALYVSCSTTPSNLTVEDRKNHSWTSGELDEKTWYNCEVLLRFNNNESDTISIEVFQSLDNISVLDGNFSYMKSCHNGGCGMGVVGKTIHLASNVNYFKIIESKKGEKSN